MSKASRTTDTEPIIAQTAIEGRVWRRMPGQDPRPTGLTPKEFVQTVPTNARIRVLAVSANDELVRALGTRALNELDFVLEIGRPVTENWRALVVTGAHPAKIMAAIEGPGSGSAATGNWRTYKLSDQRQAELVEALMTNEEVAITAAVERHPCYPGLSFVNGRDDVMLGRLLATIGDPRYHIASHRPDSSNRLWCFLGLADQVISQRGLVGLRAKLAFGAWNAKISAPVSDAPGDFVQRRWFALAEKVQTQFAHLQTTRFFVDYLRLVWLDAVSHRAIYPGFHGPLVPAHFFNYAQPFAPNVPDPKHPTFQPEPETAKALARHLGRS